MKSQIKSIFFILIIINLFIPWQVLAIGQITKPIIIENALRGQEIDQIITIVNTEDKEVLTSLFAEKDMKDWTTFYTEEDLDTVIDSVTIAAKSQMKVIARFIVPEDIPNGVYEGLVSVLKEAEKVEETTDTVATIKQKISRQVTITVTDQEEINITVAIIPEKYDLIEGESFKFRVIYDNQGNIEVKPQVKVKLEQTDNIIYNAIMPYPEDEEGVKPLARHEIAIIEVPVTGAVPGKVGVQFTVLYNDEVVHEESIRFSFNMFTETDEEDNGKEGSAIPVPIMYIILGVLFIIVLVGAIYFSFKYHKEKKNFQKKAARNNKSKAKTKNSKTKRK